MTTSETIYRKCFCAKLRHRSADAAAVIEFLSGLNQSIWESLKRVLLTDFRKLA